MASAPSDSANFYFRGVKIQARREEPVDKQDAKKAPKACDIERDMRVPREAWTAAG
jgi:hypothetical protein